MCGYEVDDPCDVYEVSYPRSREERTCIVCCAKIAKGEIYARHSMLYDGSASSECACACCELAINAFRADPHHRGSPSPYGFAEALRECFEGARKTDPDVKLWRDLYAGILRRGLGWHWVSRAIEHKRAFRNRLPPPGGKRSTDGGLNA